MISDLWVTNGIDVAIRLSSSIVSNFAVIDNNKSMIFKFVYIWNLKCQNTE